MASTKVGISCACRQITGFIEIPNSQLPLSIDICHCTTCRHITGQLCNSKFIAPRPSGGQSTLHVEGDTVSYKSSKHLTRYFCGNCGASIYNHDSTTGSDNIASGVIDRADGILELKQHMFVEETKDGGLTSWLEAPAWAGQPDGSKKLEGMTKKPESLNRDPHAELSCYCECRGVQFKITSPNQDSLNVSSPLPDLLFPSHLHPGQAPSYLKWWLCAQGTKYFAGTCACNSCRLSTGYDIQAWAFVPKPNILQIDGKALDYGMGTLKRYSHSKGAYREFCSRCGATVFWHCDERPDLIDVSVGLLDAATGARAEEWLEWAIERVSFEECAQNTRLVSAVSAGLRKWAGARGFSD